MGEKETISYLEQLFPIVIENNHLSHIKSKLASNNFELVRDFIQNKFEEITEHLQNEKPIFVSEMFFCLIGLDLVGIRLDVHYREIILTYLKKMISTNYGMLPITSTLNWHEKTGPTIYATYYGLSCLYVLDYLSEFMEQNKTWAENTVEWLIRCQSPTGDFIDSTAPFSKKIENTFWSISILSHVVNMPNLKKYNTEIEKKIHTSFEWVSKIFLNDEKEWSITKMFYAIAILSKSEKIEAIGEENKQKIKKFLLEMQNEGLFHEFKVDVKQGYRVDANEAQRESVFHSTVFAYLLRKLLDHVAIPPELLSVLTKKFKQKTGYGTQLKIKSMKYGTDSTTFENVLLLILCLCI